MAHNDLRDASLRLLAEDETASARLHAFRLSSSQLYEIAGHIKATQDEWPEVADFLAALPDETRTDLDVVTRSWTNAMRPRAARKLQNAMRDAATVEGSAQVGPPFGEIRFDFADEIAVQFLGGEEAFREIAARLRDGILAFWRFAQTCFEVYMRSLPVTGQRFYVDGHQAST